MILLTTVGNECCGSRVIPSKWWDGSNGEVAKISSWRRRGFSFLKLEQPTPAIGSAGERPVLARASTTAAYLMDLVFPPPGTNIAEAACSCSNSFMQRLRRKTEDLHFPFLFPDLLRSIAQSIESVQSACSLVG